jgi:hypothetical protein
MNGSMNQVTEGVYLIQGQDEMIPDSHVYLIGKPSSRTSPGRCRPRGQRRIQIALLTDAGIELSRSTGS